MKRHKTVYDLNYVPKLELVWRKLDFMAKYYLV